MIILTEAQVHKYNADLVAGSGYTDLHGSHP